VDLPHRFPFRWIDRPSGGRARLAWTAAAYWHREDPLAPVGWVAEAMAQAAALTLGDPAAASRRLSLAGLEGIECLRAPLAGEILEIEVRLEGRWGGVLRVAAEVTAGGAVVARGALLLAGS
jgi:3-hydroxymyristoyl/3-hydroxydecanoyl-(acyl carrier protein) dehydratase